MPLSIIIVNYRSAQHIINCLRSAVQFPSAQKFEWIIADNNSQDGSKALITQQFPFIKWIDMNYNAGFARANNAGIQASAGETVLLLNPDTIILDDAIQKCYERFSASAHAACAVQLLNEDGTPQITGNYFMTGGLNHLLPLPYTGAVLRKIAFAFGAKKTNVPQAADGQIVDWINGAFLMVKKSAIEKAGLMDEDFFLYSEEIEWCSRIKKAGTLCVYGSLHTIHLQGETTAAATGAAEKGYYDLYTKKGLQLMVSNHLRIRKQFGAGWFLFHLIMHTIAIPVFSLCSIFDNLFHRRHPFATLPKVEAFTENTMQIWKLMPKMISNKPHFYKMM
ncbi:MAG TPA: glycosyltransferase family 2 protein [Chitinophagaceae bacterium]|nr:glycosyltransferase family 2 protein [Chitinophagaceae bacterium]